MDGKIQGIIPQVKDLVEAVVEKIGFELVDVEYISIGGRWILRLYIDKEGGVTIDDCARVSGEIGILIDVKDIIAHEYVLEVSSPGLDRPLKKEIHFLEAVGKKVKIKMKFPVEGRRNFTGYLREFRNRTLFLEMETGEAALPWQGVEKANLVYEFDS
ncbi:MAG: ribosome maturation factor RimP [Deltaproteobacteria bacterium]|nr:ribosome maturation factor RimP [Deltaproteobacteria bacterium]